MVSAIDVSRRTRFEIVAMHMPKTTWTRPQRIAASAVIVAALVGAGTLGTFWVNYSNRNDAIDITKQANLNSQIDYRINQNPTLALISSKMDDVLSRLSNLEGWKEGVGSQVRILKESVKKQSKQQDILQRKIGQQEALTRIQNPDWIFATIRAQLQMAESARKIVPVSDITDYKNALSALPTSARGYWITAAAIINYQSFVNQLAGRAPNPAAISSPCLGLTNKGRLHSKNNLFIGVPISNCVVDLDGQGFVGTTFINAVIRYHGGPVTLRDVQFVNCAFIVDLPPEGTPSQPQLIMAILSSPDQKSIKAPPIS